MACQIYPSELQLNMANYFDVEAPFLDLDLSIKNGIISSKFMINGMILILKFLFLDGDVPRSPSYGIYIIYISQLILFARVCSNVSDLNNRNKLSRDM